MDCEPTNNASRMKLHAGFHPFDLVDFVELENLKVSLGICSDHQVGEKTRGTKEYMERLRRRSGVIGGNRNKWMAGLARE